MDGLFWLSEAQMAQLAPFFPEVARLCLGR